MTVRPLHASPTAVIVPIKPFSEAKTRLAAAFGPAQRAEIAERLARRVLAAVRDAGLRAIVVTSDRSARIVAVEASAEIVDEEVLRGLNAAWELGLARAESLGFAAVLLLPADLPHVDACDITAVMKRPGCEGVVIAPSHDGDGTNAMCVPLPSPVKPAYGPGSFSRHVAAALGARIPLRVIRRAGLAIDADRPGDLGTPTGSGGREQTS